MRSILILLVVFFMCHSRGMAQYAQTVLKFDEAYQSCLDSGVGMHGCTNHYYEQMDSMLNVVYKETQVRYPGKQKALKQEQRAWLRRRDLYFRKVNNSPEEMRGTMEPVIRQSKRAMYVHDRVLEMVKNYLEK